MSSGEFNSCSSFRTLRVRGYKEIEVTLNNLHWVDINWQNYHAGSQDNTDRGMLHGTPNMIRKTHTIYLYGVCNGILLFSNLTIKLVFYGLWTTDKMSILASLSTEQQGMVSSWDGHALTHWGWGKLAAIFQTTFWNAFSWMKMYEFRLKFH